MFSNQSNFKNMTTPCMGGVEEGVMQKFNNCNKHLKEKAMELRNHSTLAEGMLLKYVLRASGWGIPLNIKGNLAQHPDNLHKK